MGTWPLVSCSAALFLKALKLCLRAALACMHLPPHDTLTPQVPNLVADVGLNGVAALQQLKAEEGIAGAVKLGLAGLLSVGARV